MGAHIVSWPVPAEFQDLRVSNPGGPKHLPGPLMDRWARELQSWEAPDQVQGAFSALTNPETLVVIAGQQPGVWGGPLYSFLKAASTIALSERISEDLNRPSVAVFWVQGDDTDWDEVGWGTLPQKDLSLYRYRWHPSPIPPRHWVGSAPAPEDATEVLAGWNVAPRPGSTPPSDLASDFIQRLLSLFGHRGLIPLDSRWSELRAGGKDLWEHYLHHHRDLSAAVLEHGQDMKNGGLPAPIDAETADHGLFPLDEERRREIDPARWDTEIRELLSAGEPERLAPSVLLRGLLQDYLFGTTAQVVGTAEAAYLAQLTPLYNAFEVPVPVRFPRLEATIIPQGLWPRDETAGVLEDPEGWIAGQARARLPQTAAADLETLRRSLKDSIQGVLDSHRDSGGELAEVGESVKRRMEAQLDRLEQVVLRRSRQALYRQHPSLRNLAEFLRPRRGPQDRGLSGLSLSLFFGSSAADAVLDAARSHVSEAYKKSRHHFALEAPRV